MGLCQQRLAKINADKNSNKNADTERQTYNMVMDTVTDLDRGTDYAQAPLLLIGGVSLDKATLLSW